MTKRTVFFLSDGTGITVEAIAHSLLSQFEGIEFNRHTIPFINSAQMAREVVARINTQCEFDGQRALIFSTLVDEEVRNIIRASDGFLLDVFDAFISPLEKELGARSRHVVGRTHGVSHFSDYKSRIDAINYAFSNDDGAAVNKYDQADIIIIGVSRSGKTPACLYLAMNYGLKAANYPITEEDLGDIQLPAPIRDHADKLFGLTIDPYRLQQIRSERRPNSRYATLTQCAEEVNAVKQLFQSHNIPFIDTSNASVEEIATAIIHKTGLRKQLYAGV